MKRSVEAAFETLQKDEKFLKEHPHVKEHINNVEFKQLIDAIWPDEHRASLSGSSLKELIKIVAIHPKKMCTLLGLTECYEKTYKGVVEDTQTAQAHLQCKDITPPSQQPSYFSWLWRTPPTPTKRYSIQVGSQEPIILGITRERQEGVYYLDAEEKSKPLRQLAFFWMALDPSRTVQGFLNELNECIADPKSSTPSNNLRTK